MNKNSEEKHISRSPFWRYLFVVTTVLTGIWLILYVILQRFGLLLHTLRWDISSNAASIGIIGGADGPTAVFVTGKVGFWPDWDVLLVLLIFIGSLLAWLRLRRTKQK